MVMAATAQDDEPGWTSRWIRRDPAGAVALALIVIQVLWRAYVGSRGFIAHDDFFLAIKAHETKLSADYLLTHFNNHLMPAPMAYMWWITKTFGYVYWPYLTAMIVGQAVLSFSFYRLLRLLLPPGWGLLIPLCVFLFSPLNLETTSWWVFGMFMLPMELAMVWSIGSLVKFARTRRKLHLVTLAAALVFGLLFAEKALLIVPLLFGLAACLLVRGGPGRSIWRALRWYWPAWVALLVVSAGYLALYQIHADSSLRKPESVDEVLTFLGQLFGETLVPGLLGGPWQWLDPGAGAPLAGPSPALQIAALVVLAAVIAFTIWRRPAAGRAWTLLLWYAALAAGLIAASRMGAVLSSLAGLVTRYTSDIVVVAALCLGVALFGMQGVPDRLPPRRIAWLSTTAGRATAVIAGGLAALVLIAGSVITTTGFARIWSVQPGRDFLAVSQAELANAKPGTVFLDLPVPSNVMAQYYYPHNLQSRFFSVLKTPPVFVASGENPSVFDEKGHIRPAWVEPARKTKPGPNGGCGYSVRGPQTVTMPLDGPMFEWPWAFRIAYLSEGQSSVKVEFGRHAYEFVAQPGLHQYFFTVEGGGESIDVTVQQPGVGMCITEIMAGKFVPWLL